MVLPETSPLLLVCPAEKWPKLPFWHHSEQCHCAQQLKAPTQVAAETEQCQNLHPALLASLLLVVSTVTLKGPCCKTRQLVSRFQVVGPIKSKAFFITDVAPTHLLLCIFQAQFLNVLQTGSFLKWVEPTFSL